MKRYRTIRTEPLSVNQYMPASQPQEEILSEEILKLRYRMDKIEVGKTYDGYAGMGVYVSNTILEELPEEPL